MGTIRVGVGGWNYAPWRGPFYPAGLAQKRELEFASRELTSIEINATFYSSFKPADFAKWSEQTPEGFVFSLKASRFCTNRRQLAAAGESITRFFGQGIEQLGDRLGPVNWQFAETKVFDPEDFGGFLKCLPREIAGRRLRHALEPRHPSFACEQFYDLARRHDCAIVLVDSAQHPEIDANTSDFTYARLMRSEEAIPTGYSTAALDGWATRAKHWAERGDAFIYFIAGAKLRAPAAARALIQRLG